jgi:hypothetical protein
LEEESAARPPELKKSRSPMKNQFAIASAFVCPVCGQHLASTDPVCTECGAILALRAPRAREVYATDRVKSRLLDVWYRGISALTVAISTLMHHRRRLYVIVALVVATMIAIMAVAGLFSRFRRPAEIAARETRQHVEVRREPAPERQSQLPRAAERVGSVTTSRTRPSAASSMALGMLGAAVLAALLGAVAVNDERRRRRAAPASEVVAMRLRRRTQAAAVAAAFCFGLAVALAVVLATQPAVVLPLPARATVERERVDQWQREASTLKERLSSLDARLSSLESTRGGEGTAGQQPARTAGADRVARSGPKRGDRPAGTIAEQEANAVSAAPLPPPYAASTRSSTADVLRSPRVASEGNLGERVWIDIQRDWERVRRSVRDLIPGESR